MQIHLSALDTILSKIHNFIIIQLDKQEPSSSFVSNTCGEISMKYCGVTLRDENIHLIEFSGTKIDLFYSLNI